MDSEKIPETVGFIPSQGTFNAIPNVKSSLGETKHIATAINFLRKIKVFIPEYNQVHDYLLRYPDMIDILPLVCKKATEKWEEKIQLSLEVYHDPEIEDEYLTLYVRQKDYDENIMDQIKEIRAIYEEMLIEKNGWFLMTTDFKPPREMKDGF